MICNHCGSDKDKREFTKNISKPSGFHPTCKECRRNQNKRYYLKTKGRFAECRDKSRKRMSAATKQYVIEYKTKRGCARCPERDFRCLDFHHIDPTTKVSGVSRLRGCSLKKLKEEIEKCEVICSNCHRKEHYGSVV